jgi:electron transfer flavoprotein beta subunit
MHIIVCIKSVVRSAPKGVAKRDLENSELNPFDRPALEAALQLKSSKGGTVTALSMGPPVAGAALAEALAMGADRAVLLSDAAMAGSDTLVTARVLAAAITRLAPFDFLCFGVRTADSDTGQVGPQTAAQLKLPFISGVRKITCLENQWEVERLMDEWEEVWEVQAPAVLTIDPRAFLPRHIGLSALAAVYDEAKIETWNLEQLELSPERAGLNGSPTRVAALHPVKQSRRCTMLDGQPAQQVEALVEHLINKGIRIS